MSERELPLIPSNLEEPLKQSSQASLANEVLWLLVELSSELSTALDLDNLQCILSRKLRWVFNYDRCTLAVQFNPSDTEYSLFEITSPSKAASTPSQKISLDEGWSGRVLTEAKPYFIEDLAQLSSRATPPINAHWDIDPQARSLMLLPLQSREFTVGSINFSTKTPNTYSGVWRNLASLLATQVGAQLGSILAHQDTTSLLKALRMSEEKFSKAFRSSPDAITISTLTDGRYIEVNDSFLHLTGYSREEVIGYTSTERRIWVNPADRIKLEKILQQEGIASNLEFNFRMKSGAVRVALVSAETINLGSEPYLLAVSRDITERRAMDQMKDEFVSIVSHELRTPLTSIRGALGLFASGRLATVSPIGQRMLDVAIASIDRLVRLVNNILDVERIESGEIMIARVMCDAGDLINQVAEVFQDMVRQAGLTLSVSPTSAQVWADPDRIIQVLTNLVSNAIKFSSQGGMVWLTTESQAEQILFQVKDQGRGIPPDRLRNIFDRFQQVDASDTRKDGGVGLGLSICRSIVQQHGGQIWAESKVGTGSTFFFSLPLNQEKPATPMTLSNGDNKDSSSDSQANSSH